MVGTVKTDVDIPSAEKLGVATIQEKSHGNIAEKSTSQKKPEFSIGYGFSAQELDAEIGIDELVRNDIVVSSKMKQEGVLDRFRMQNSKDDPATAKKKMGEICITQILFYKGLQEFRNKLSEDFIQSFTPAEQAFLQKMAERLDDYIQIYKAHIDQLLNMLGYSSLERFVDEMLALPKPAARESNRQVSFTLEEQNPETNFLSEIGDWFSKISENLGITTSVDKSAVDVKKDERLAQLVECARVNRENMALCLAGKISSQEKMAQFLKIARGTGEKVRDIPLRVAKYGVKYKNLAMYYAQSTLPQHAERRAQCIQAEASIVSPGNGYDLNTYIFNAVLPRIGLLYSELAECIDKEWNDASLGNVSEYVAQLRHEDAKVLRQKNEAERNYVLCPMSLLPGNDPAQAEKGRIYIDENTYRYVVLGADGKPKAGLLPKQFTKSGEHGGGDFTIDLHDFQARLEDEKLMKAILAFTSMQGHTIDNDIAGIRRPKSVHRLSGIIGRAEGVATRVKSTIVTQGRFSGEKSDLCTEGSYFSYVRRAWEVVQSYQGAKEGDASTEGWALKRVRSNGTRTEQKTSKISERFRKGSPAEIYQHDELVCTITPQKVAGGAKNELNGVGIEVHRHQEKDIALAVRIMAASLVGKKKEICITVDLDNPGMDELALQYAEGILKQCIIPILCDGDKELSIEETKAKLSELCAALAAKGNHHYDNLVELYEEHLKMVDIEKDEDKAFLKAFDAFIGASPATSKVSLEYPKGIVLNREAIVSQLALAFKHRNLTTGQFVDNIARYARAIAPRKGAGFTSKQFESLKEKLRNYVDYCISNELLDLTAGEAIDSTDHREVHFAKQIFNMALGALEPELDMSQYEHYFFSARKPQDLLLDVTLTKKSSDAVAPEKSAPQPVVENDKSESAIEEQSSSAQVELKSDIVVSEFDLPEPVKVEFIGFEKELAENVDSNPKDTPIVFEESVLPSNQSEVTPPSVVKTAPTVKQNSKVARGDLLTELSATLKSGFSFRKVSEQEKKAPAFDSQKQRAQERLYQTMATAMARSGLEGDASKERDPESDGEWEDDVTDISDNAAKKEDSPAVVVQPKFFGMFGPKCHVNQNPEKPSADRSENDTQDVDKNTLQNAHPFSSKAARLSFLCPPTPQIKTESPSKEPTKPAVPTRSAS